MKKASFDFNPCGADRHIAVFTYSESRTSHRQAKSSKVFSRED